MTQQGELLPVSHRSMQRRRLKKRTEHDGAPAVNPERVYAAAWLRRHREDPRFLNKILWPLDDPKHTWGPPGITRRDAAVAASIVQWLGTNVGLGFVYACERTIAEAIRSAEERRRRPSLHDLEREREARAKTKPKRAINLRRGRA